MDSLNAAKSAEVPLFVWRCARGLCASEELAHNGPESSVPSEGREFLCCTAARSRALCAFKQPRSIQKYLLKWTDFVMLIFEGLRQA